MTKHCPLAGSGKTVLSSAVIQTLSEKHLNESEANILYFYFDFADDHKQTVRGCLGSLLRQLSQQKLSPIVEALYLKSRNRSTRPSSDELLHTLKTVLQQAQAPLTFIILDALDECLEVEVMKLMEALAKVKRWEIPRVRILATSREEPNIKQAMSNLACPIWLEPALVDNAIKIFVKHNFQSHGALSRWSGDGKIEQEIEDTFAAKSNGM
jgi:hypothetical protein